jgi:hypothetical protein
LSVEHRIDVTTSSSGVNFGIKGKAALLAASDNNMTAVAGLRGVDGQVGSESSSSGVVTGGAVFYAESVFENGATFTNTYGLYLADQSVGDNNWGIFDAGNDWAMAATNKLYFDGGSNTYITESAGDRLSFFLAGNEDMRLDSSTGQLDVEGDVVAFSTSIGSDLRLKKNIHPVVDPLDKINQLRGVTFDWKDEEKGSSVGVIAQEVEKIYPELVSVSSLSGMKTVNYNGLIGVLIEAVKELSDKVGV